MAETQRPAGFKPADAAHQLSISRTGLYNLIKKGVLGIVKIGTRTVVPVTEIDRLLSVDDSE